MIDLDKIIDSNITFNADLQSRDEIKDCMKGAIRQALELAAEQAGIRDREANITWSGIVDTECCGSYEVDKDSIKNVINEVKG